MCRTAKGCYRRRVARACGSGGDACEEVADVPGDFLQVALQGEVSGLEEMDLGVGQVALEGAGSVRAEDFVVGPPNGQQRHLAVAEVLLQLGVEGDVGRIVPEQCELDGVV